MEELSQDEAENMKKKSGRGRRPKHYLTTPTDRIHRHIDSATMSATFDFAINKVMHRTSMNSFIRRLVQRMAIVFKCYVNSNLANT